MKRAFLLFAFLFTACAPQTVEQTPAAPVNLLPYTTQTPSATPDEPTGLVTVIDTPQPSPTPFVYEVQKGDTMSGIAFQFGISVDDLIAANPDVSPYSMSIGTKLNIPGKTDKPASASTPTPVPVPVKQIECYPTADQGLWCFTLVHNETPNVLENLSAQVNLLDADGKTLTSGIALSPLNILPPDASLPLMVFFNPPVPADGQPQVQILSGIPLEADDARYLPVSLHNTLVEIDAFGRSAQVSGTVLLPEDAQPAGLVWVAAVAYDEAGRVIGVRRWESTDTIAPGDSVQFSFDVYSLAGKIGQVEFVVEARP